MQLTTVVMLGLFVFIGVPGLPAESYDTEPNDTFETAVDLPIGASSDGTVNGFTDPADYFKVTVPSDGKMTITVTHEPSDFQFILYGATASDEIAGTETNAPSGRQIVATIQAGIYRIQVNSRYNSTPIAYTITVTHEPAKAVTEDSEPNDTYEIAGALTLNATQVGHISYVGTDGFVDGLDYYSFLIPESATVTFSFTHDPPGIDFQFTIYGADGTSIIAGTQTNFPSGETKVLYLSAGSYYLAVNGRVFYTSYNQGRVYEVLVSTDVHPAAPTDMEPNDTFETASDFATPDGTTGHISFMKDSAVRDNQDYWSWTVPGDKRMGVWLTVTHDPIGSAFQIIVYNSEQGYVSGTETNAPSPRTLKFLTDPGKHYMLIDGRGQSIGRTYNASVVYYDPEVGTPTPTASPTPTRTPIPTVIPNNTLSDINNDGFIDEEDMLILLSDWHKSVKPRDE